MIRGIKTTSPQQFHSQTAGFLVEQIRTAQHDHGTCIIGLSGGATPGPVYEELGKMLCTGEGTLRFFLVDERSVPPDHPESNQRFVRATLLKHLPFPEEHLVFPNTMLPIDDCVADYARRLKALWKDHLPDLIVLGMGTDGHIASLFPPLTDSALGSEHLVLATRAPEGIGPPSARDRITLSLNALCAAEQSILLLGPEKKRTWEIMMASDDDERRWPLKRIMETGRLTVFTQPPAPPW